MIESLRRLELGNIVIDIRIKRSNKYLSKQRVVAV
jgi:hypothetical protein